MSKIKKTTPLETSWNLVNYFISGLSPDFNINITDEDIYGSLGAKPTERASVIFSEKIAKMFHNFYEEKALELGLLENKFDRVPWDDVSEENKELLVKTCEEVLINLYSNKFEIEESFFEDEEENLDLEPVKDFMDNFIGGIVTGFKVCDEDIEDLDDKIKGSIISDVSVDDDSLLLYLSSLKGISRGLIKISPTEAGEFALRYNEEPEMWASMYRIKLYGGEMIEYLDTNNEGTVSFIDNQRENL